ncbi:elongation factor G-binding protein [Brevibacillus fluminis]|uniref:Elongation factor G-binding protein n=1 Tax=Brevibacillus fluminis TaxID=511487 RepID=A0A3M8DHE7_9BACL|nr:FusB/FusC family EF-G-binding protein [Brevibacillus fluminis]RNB86901.1 elongation factor G-binding protein [Brevibacillus fluminis]
MNTPFIKNHQFNFIKQQVKNLQSTLMTVSDPKVIEGARFGAEAKIFEQFLAITNEQKQLFAPLLTLKKPEEFQEFVTSLTPYLSSFPKVTEKQIQKLFPKNKKLKTPNLDALNYTALTYIGWIDIATNKMFFVYEQNNQIVGIEGRFTATNKKNVCSLCNGVAEVALFSAITKTKNAKYADYYKAVGNYMCIDSAACNAKIKDLTYLESFIASVLENA